MPKVLVNGAVREVAGHRSLLMALREELGLTAAKYGCAEGECGACTVWVGGQPARACVTPVEEVGDRPVLTLEGLAPRALQRAFAEEGAMQCGFCTPGMIMSAAALLRDVPKPDEGQVRAALQGNICRCGTYPRILRAVQRAAELGPSAPEPPAPAALPDVTAPLGPGWTFLVEPSFPRGGLPAGGAAVHLSTSGELTALAGKVELGQGIRAGLSLAVAQELRVPVGQVRLVLGDTALCPWDIGTFGSRSTPAIGAALRAAAAALRDALVDAAARRWSVPREAVTLSSGRVLAGDGRSATWSELVGGAQVHRVPRDRPVTPATEWPADDRAVPNLRAWEIVAGLKRFPADVHRPGMLHGCALRAPAFGATLRSADTSAAEQLPGVTVVRQGERVAVAAADPIAARQALARIRAEWDLAPQPSEEDLERHLREHPVDLSGWEGPVHRETGDVRARDRAKVTREATYRTAYIAHVPIETRAAVAEWAGDALTVWSGTQRPFGVREALAEALQIPEERVRVIGLDTGTGFGGKQGDEAAIDAALLARAAGRPVKVMWSREEELTWGYFRPAAIVDVASAAGADGKLLSWDLRTINAGAAALFSPYAAPHQSTHFQPAASPLEQGPYRSLAAVANTFARESQMDELASALGVDPVRFRLDNLEDERLAAVIRAAAERAGWSSRAREPGVGTGIAAGLEKGGRVATVARVRAVPGEEIRVLRLVTAYECGAVVDADAVRGQVEGCAVMGLGGALFEAIHFREGRILNPHLASYRVPRFSDLPEIEIVLLDRKDQPSAGAGETPIIAVAPAIANAVFEASGRRLRSLPLQGDPAWTK